MNRPSPFPEPVYTTRPVLPPLGEYVAELTEIWRSGWLTNNGAKHQAFESELATLLRAPHLSLFNNGTTALSVACRALRLSGEVITTPFTFPATPHVLAWNGVAPVFADIDPETLTLDPEQVGPLVTPRTTGILGVHVYGMPCRVSAIQRIADRYGLHVIYDGAHAFGTEIDGAPLASFGDATMLSFHATKLFHTAEGGALVVKDAHLKQRVDHLKNFGIASETEVVMAGINGKMNELQAALGLVNLRHFEAERSRRARLAAVYRERLGEVEGLSCLAPPANVHNSHQYFVIRVRRERQPGLRDALYERLKSFNIFARRYFYPLVSDASCYRALPSAGSDNLPLARRAASEVLALPFFGELGIDGVHRVCDAIAYALEG
jgi:dTDP-4-amino-4,6-dideoxygalactose transaminase